jgi:sterol desaturase/sphingolipid hydroxylase (fatty acid hydroxylase superfamily)
LFALRNVSVTAFILTAVTAALSKHGLISFKTGPVAWWVVALEHLGYFFGFITATFHDQHHKYFKWNFGGYTAIWDFLCGTVRPKYPADFDQIKACARGAGATAAPAGAAD